jgi:ABC-type Fe3+ transport system permease subunit
VIETNKARGILGKSAQSSLLLLLLMLLVLASTVVLGFQRRRRRRRRRCRCRRRWWWWWCWCWFSPVQSFLVSSAVGTHDHTFLPSSIYMLKKVRARFPEV